MEALTVPKVGVLESVIVAMLPPANPVTTILEAGVLAKLSVVMLPEVPTTAPSSLTSIPFKVPAPAAVTACQLHPPDPSATTT